MCQNFVQVQGFSIYPINILNVLSMNSSRLFIIIAFLSTISLVISSCNVTSSDDNEEHQEPWGLILLDSGVEIARQFNGEVTYTTGDHLDLEEGEESSLITLRFLDEEGNAFTPHDDDETFLEWVIEPESVLEIEQHEEDGKWSFHFAGVEAGDAHIVFMLMHGEEGHAHADFESLEFEIHVH